MLTASVMLATACGGNGGSDEVTLEEYFEELEAVLIASLERGQESDIASIITTASTWEDGRELYMNLSESLYALVADLKDLEPSGDAVPLHEEYVEGLSELADGTAAVASIVSEQEALDFLDAEGAQVFATLFGTAATCQELQVLADEREIEVQLACSSYAR